MNFDNAMSFLFDGYAVVFDDDHLVYLGEDDETFYVDLEDSGKRYVFTKENNSGVCPTYGNSGVILYDEDGEKHTISRLMLA